MDEQELREIIALILDAIEEVMRPKRALVLFTGALLGFQESLAGLGQLSRAGWQMTSLMTTSAEYLLDKAKIDELGMVKPGGNLVAHHDVLIIPTCTVNTVAKVACGIADSLATNLISEFLSTGKTVVAASTGADPDSAAKKARFPLLGAAQASLWRDNLNRARALGVRFCEAADLASCVDSTLTPASGARTEDSLGDVPQSARRMVGVGRLVSGSDIQPLPAGSVLAIPRDAVVTAMAIDLARTRSIRIERA